MVGHTLYTGWIMSCMMCVDITVVFTGKEEDFFAYKLI